MNTKEKIYPFKFLDSYTAEDTNIFFGRDEEIELLYQMIFQTDILLLYGASGTGKTSLVQCGLASRFQRHDWLEIFIRRHSNINDSLKRALDSKGGSVGQEETEAEEDLDWLDNLMEEDAEIKRTKKNLSATEEALKNIYLQHFRPIYLIFDQFEELFILGTKAEQHEFIKTVKEILQVEQPVKLIFSIREEYLGSLYEFEKMVPELLRKKLRIEPMNLEKVRNVIIGATTAKNSIVHIEKGQEQAIAESIFEKIRGKENSLSIQLPYLQVFLDKLYRHISGDKSRTPKTEATFSTQALQEIGDIGDILRDFLEERTIDIARELNAKAETIWKILSPFVTIEGTKEPISLAYLYQSLPDLAPSFIDKVVNALINDRIMRYLEGEDLYEIAHDSLALSIAAKRTDEEIAILEVKRLIKSQTALKEDARELFTEKQLNFIEPYLPKLHLEKEEKQLLDQSHQAVEAQKKALAAEELRKKRFRQILGVIGLVVILIMTGLTVWAFQNASKFKEQKETADKALKDKREADSLKNIADQEAAEAAFKRAIEKASSFEASGNFEAALAQLDGIDSSRITEKDLLVIKQHRKVIQVSVSRTATFDELLKLSKQIGEKATTAPSTQSIQLFSQAMHLIQEAELYPVDQSRLEDARAFGRELDRLIYDRFQYEYKKCKAFRENKADCADREAQLRITRKYIPYVAATNRLDPAIKKQLLRDDFLCQ
jgi:KaiC/GvpD/RAD55 family RecA-like ATPase